MLILSSSSWSSSVCTVSFLVAVAAGVALALALAPVVVVAVVVAVVAAATVGSRSRVRCEGACLVAVSLCASGAGFAVTMARLSRGNLSSCRDALCGYEERLIMISDLVL